MDGVRVYVLERSRYSFLRSVTDIMRVGCMLLRAFVCYDTSAYARASVFAFASAFICSFVCGLNGGKSRLGRFPINTFDRLEMLGGSEDGKPRLGEFDVFRTRSACHFSSGPELVLELELSLDFNRFCLVSDFRCNFLSPNFVLNSIHFSLEKSFLTAALTTLSVCSIV